jgi:hypothetical protein
MFDFERKGIYNVAERFRTTLSLQRLSDAWRQFQKSRVLKSHLSCAYAIGFASFLSTDRDFCRAERMSASIKPFVDKPQSLA